MVQRIDPRLLTAIVGAAIKAVGVDYDNPRHWRDGRLTPNAAAVAVICGVGSGREIATSG